MNTIKLNKTQETIFQNLAPRLEKMSGSAKVWIALCVVSILLGFFALIQQVLKGHVVTGMRDHIVWGLYISNFIYFIGISYAGAALAAILHYFKVPWGRPIIRISSLMALSTGIVGPVFILLCIGRFDRLHELFINARVQSPITWDVMVISTYLVGIFLFVYLLLIRDFAILRDSKLKLAPWRKKLYKILSLGYIAMPKQDQEIDNSTKAMSMIMVPKIILAFSVLAWIFGMTLRPGWHSTIFGTSFVISSVATGISLVICIMWFYRRACTLENYITEQHFKNMGYILVVLTLAFGYVTFTEYITTWYSSGVWEQLVMDKLFDWSEFGWWFHLTNLFGIVVPITVMAIPKLRTPNLISLAAVLLVIAMWIKRYLIVVPTLETPLLPMQDTRPEYVEYVATWSEWALSLAGVATILLFFLLVSHLVTIVSISAYASKK
jgi:Ni/Fe-hydrogenase subunit HybB-like protein